MTYPKKKILKVCFTLVLNNEDNHYDKVTEYKPDDASNLLENLRKALNEIYGYDNEADPPEGFLRTTKNSYNMISTELEGVEDINPT